VKDFILIVTFILGITLTANAQFVKLSGNQFSVQNQAYSFFGTNYWYGGYLASDTANNGYQRLCKELDFLKLYGITNLRVLFSGEGDASYPYRITPSVQEKPREYNESILRSFDMFLHEVAKRNIKLVLVLNNNWEWSGGFGQYLEWSGSSNPILPKTHNWDWEKYCQYISQFYSCDSCQVVYRSWIQTIITRKNSINQKIYSSDESIMAWQLANEPRPMKKEAICDYKNWISNTSSYIKSLDSNHLVSVGVEGIIGTDMDTALFTEIHSIPSIDYATIHLWPKTWQWYNGNPHHSITDTTLNKTKNYIELHSRLAQKIKKPLVIEEFGMHRDDNSFSEKSSTNKRNHYYQFVYDIGNKYGVNGYNFWGAFAYRSSRMKSDFWNKGLPHGADPPQEEQGLYGAFALDSSTWRCIYNIRK